MLSLITWYLLSTLLGWLVFPIFFRLLPALTDRGYTLIRAGSLLFWGYIFWLLASLGVLQNNPGGMLLALGMVAGLSIWALRDGKWGELRAWISKNWYLIFVSEIVFLTAFAILALIRSANPETLGTEKPMELAFINAIIRSPSFPPSDPWLSGYSISYYYFGYVMVGMLARITGIAAGTAFNLALALWFAMTAQGAYGIVYNLLAARSDQDAHKRGITPGIVSLPILGPLFILVVSNWEGFLEVLHARGLFWSQAGNGTWTSSFWSWLNIQELVNPPSLPLSWMPNRVNGLIWWRASRVLQDFAYNMDSKEIIDEFPFFSYLLGDLHPHLLAMPFVVLVIGLSLALFMRKDRSSFRIFGYRIPLAPGYFLLAVLALGSLAFLNTWDFPIYVGLFAAVFAIRRGLSMGWRWARLWEFLGLGVIVGIAGILLYVPFYMGFSSQAGGFIPSLIFFTPGKYFWVMFGPLLVPILAYLVFLWVRRRDNRAFINGITGAAAVIAVLWAISFLFAELITRLPGLGDLFVNNQGAQAGLKTSLFQEAFIRRLEAPGTWITLWIILALVWALIVGMKNQRTGEIGLLGVDDVHTPDVRLFTVILIGLGVMLALVPEFIYLRDQFGWRMNTIFKFYFQIWILWGIAGAYASAVLLSELKGVKQILYSILFIVVIGMGLAYPIWGTWVKTNGFNPGGGLTLDGNAYLEQYSPDEDAAIQWLKNAPYGTIAEAVSPTGGSYSGYARYAANTGLPNVVGWQLHESQWRGGMNEVSSRPEDVQTLYTTPNWDEAKQIIEKYNIRYIVLDDLERSTYRVSDGKFQRMLKVAFQQGNVIIYEVPELVLNQASGNGN